MSTVLIPLILSASVAAIAGGGILLGGGAGDAAAGGSATSAPATAPAATGPWAGARPRTGGTVVATMAATAEPPLGGSVGIDGIRVREGDAGMVTIAVGDAGSPGDAITPPCLVAAWTSRDGSAGMWLGLDSTRPELVPATVAAAVRAAHPLPAMWIDPGAEPPATAPDGWICIALVTTPADAGWSHRAVLVPASAVLATGVRSTTGTVLIRITGDPLPGAAALVTTTDLRARLRAQPAILIRGAN